MSRLRNRAEWQFFTVLPRADRRLATLWWAVLVARGILPAVFAIATGVLVAAVQAHGDLTGPLVLVGVVFVALQVLSPVHTAISANSRPSGPMHGKSATLMVASNPLSVENRLADWQTRAGQLPRYLNIGVPSPRSTASFSTGIGTTAS